MRHGKILAIGLLAACVVGLLSATASADGFIVPVERVVVPRPPRPTPVRGAWAVKYHHVDIRVRDQVASVSIDQAFENTGDLDNMEVEYFFPVPPDAAIDSMTLVVDGKEFAAKLMKADEARKIYEDIVRRRKDPALLEYAGFGLYKTSAFPLQKGKPAKVLVTYKQVCHKDRDLVEVWYPLNTEKFSAKPLEDVQVTVDIQAKADITAVYSPTHDLDVKRKDAQNVIATYSAKNVLPIADFTVFYKAANETVGATLISSPDAEGKDGYFLMMVSPNPRTSATKVVAKDVALVFDHSGSMSGEKIRQAKDALAAILKNLNREDRFTVVAYNDAVEPFYEALADATEAKVKDALARLDGIDASGGTNIDEAMKAAMETLSKARKEGRPAYVIFLTDGQPTVGKIDEREILENAKKANQAGARLFAFGVGYEPNVRLLDKLADQNGGKSDYVKPKEPIEAKVSSLYDKIKNPVMTGLKVSIQGVAIRDAYPRELGDLFDGDQILLVGRYDAKDAGKLSAGEAGVKSATLIVKGVYDEKERAFEYNVDLRTGPTDGRYAFVEKLWAVRRVGYLLDEIALHGKSQEVIDEIIRLATRYGIVTPYTSFLADDRSGPTPMPAEEIRSRVSADSSSLMSKGGGGAEAQLGGANRNAMKDTQIVAAPSLSGPAASAKPGGKGGSVTAGQAIGYASTSAYEKDDKNADVSNVRQFSQQATYRRGTVWVASNAAHLDQAKDKDKIKTVERFSDDYFELTRKNTAAENQMLASQADDEQLLIVLRNQAYLIK